MILPEEDMLDYVQLHNEYQMPLICNGTTDLMHHLDEDEKGQNPMNIPMESMNTMNPPNSVPNSPNHRHTNSMETMHPIEPLSDQIGDQIGHQIGNGQIFGSIDYDPPDESDAEEIADDEDSDDDPIDPLESQREPLLKSMGTFQCVSCSEQHSDEERFEWSRCRCCYGRECAETLMIMALFERKIPQCVKCNEPIQYNEAELVLPGDELQILQEIYFLNAPKEAPPIQVMFVFLGAML